MLLRCCVVAGSAAIAALSTGCFSPKESDGGTASNAPTVTAEEATPRRTMGEKTQHVLPLDEALASGGVLAETSVTSTNPLMQLADASRTSAAKLGGMAVQQAIQLRNAQSISDPKPLSHSEFMNEIIKPDKPDGIMLPTLPYYQEYAWDEDAQALVAVDFPARIEEREKNR